MALARQPGKWTDRVPQIHTMETVLPTVDMGLARQPGMPVQKLHTTLVLGRAVLMPSLPVLGLPPGACRTTQAAARLRGLPELVRITQVEIHAVMTPLLLEQVILRLRLARMAVLPHQGLGQIALQHREQGGRTMHPLPQLSITVIHMMLPPQPWAFRPLLREQMRTGTVMKVDHDMMREHPVLR